jgi:hypothetical protein
VEGEMEIGVKGFSPTTGAAHVAGGASADRLDLLGSARLAHVGVMVDHVVAVAKSAVAAGR